MPSRWKVSWRVWDEERGVSVRKEEIVEGDIRVLDTFVHNLTSKGHKVRATPVLEKAPRAGEFPDAVPRRRPGRRNWRGRLPTGIGYPA